MNLMLLKYFLTFVFKKKREREKMACQRSMTPKKKGEKRWHAKEACPQQIKSDMKRSSRKYEYKPVDPIFDLATDLSQADDILPHPSKLHIYHQSR